MTTSVPDMLPMLARGKHRTPKRGACFMELASYLAGERWSDKPACTDSSLAHLARLVNDFTSDARRPLLAPLIPSVIGLRGLGAGFDDEMALLAATHALPIASMERQRGLAVGVLRTLGELDDYRTLASPDVRQRARAAVAAERDAQSWARSFAAQVGLTQRDESSARVIVEVSVRGIAEACVSEPEKRLRELLVDAVEFAQARAASGVPRPAPAPLEPAVWRAVVRPAEVRDAGVRAAGV